MTTTQVSVEIPPVYRQAIRFGAFWTLGISPYLILYIIVTFLLGGVAVGIGQLKPTLEMAGSSPWRFDTVIMLDAIFHVLFFVTTVTLYAALRKQWPVSSALILACGTWQMVAGLTKGLSSVFTLSPLGAAFVGSNTTLKATLLTFASSLYGLRLALQTMDSFGIVVIWLVISMLPSSSGIPRLVRGLGWIMSLAILAATPSGPTFFIVVLLFPVWLFIMGRWLLRQATPN